MRAIFLTYLLLIAAGLTFFTIIGLTHQEGSLRHMAIEWGVTPIQIDEANDVEDLWQSSVEAARDSGLVSTGDRVVITAGTAVNIPGSTNVIKVDIA